MPSDVHIVLSLPPAGVDEAAYGDWYQTHVSEILETPGFLAARRYWLAPASPERPALEFRHLSLYALDRPSAEPLAELERRIGAGTMTIPDWFGDIRWGAFDGRPLEDEELRFADHAYLVLSHAPRRFTTEEFFGWYYAHARENLTSEGFEAVWRFALTPSAVDPEGPAGATHGAFYEVDGDLPELRSALAESARARRVDIPDWMPEGEFVSWDCLAAAPAATAGGRS
jgi:hypothetical protein